MTKDKLLFWKQTKLRITSQIASDSALKKKK